MKKFVWMMVLALAGASVFADTNAVPATPPAKKAGTKASPKAAPKKSVEKKKAAPAEKAAAPAAPEKPIVLKHGDATITGDHVNVRGQATFVGEIIKRLNKGDKVTVVEQVIREKPKAGEPTQWAKILYPAGANVWVHNTYVSNNVVVPKKLNVRAGPGENYSVVGNMERGAAVKEISRKGNWVEIEPPISAFAFLAAQYLKQEGPVRDVPEVVSIAPPVNEVPVPTTVSNQPPIAVATTDDTTNAVPVLPVEDVNKPPPPAEEPLPPRIVSHEGVVRPTVSIQAPTKYEIWEPSNRMSINYLYSTSTNLDVARYRGLRVIVTGEEGLDERWRNTPVITIQRIQVVE